MSKWIMGKFGYHKEYFNGFIKASIKCSSDEIIVRIIGERTVTINCQSINDAMDIVDKYVKDLIESEVQT